jgi:hypothetical protein
MGDFSLRFPPVKELTHFTACRSWAPSRIGEPLARASLVSHGMSLCASCGLQLSGDASLCPHHHCVYGDDWAVANRIMCDFFHRRKVPPRLAAPDRDDDFWAHTAEAA